MTLEMKKTKPQYLGMSILDIGKTRIDFGMIMLDQSMETEQNYAIQIQIALLFTL